jgi:cell division protein FtsW
MRYSLIKPRRPGKMDYSLAIIVFALIVIGLIMISSASVVISYQKTGNNYFYLQRQVIWMLIGLIAMVIFSLIDYRIWRKLALPLMIIALLFLAVVLLPYFSSLSHGANRWIILGPVNFQPSEFAKLAIIIYLSGWLARRKDDIKSFSRGFLPFLFILAIVIFLVMREPDLGTMAIIAGAAAIVFFVAGASWIHVVLGASSGIMVILALILAAPYRLNRLFTFLNPGSDSSGAGYQIKNALIAVGSGGLWGLGFGNSRQKYLYLPEAHTDAIFAVIVEEIGFIRASSIIILFVLLGYRGFKIAKEAEDDFGRYLAVGITSWFILQAFINLAAILSLIPLTGVPLPFISYGGSSLVISLAAVGILLNISKYRNTPSPVERSDEKLK